MLRHSTRAARASAASLFALALVMGLLVSPPIASAWPGGGGADVALDNFTATSKDGDVFTIKHADFTNTNLSKDEIVKLLTPDTPVDDERALAQKLKADKISIPAIDIAMKKGGAIHLHNLLASDVDSGKLGKLTISGVDGGGVDKDGPFAVKSGAILLESAELASLLQATAAPAGDQAQSGRIGHVSWQSLDLTVPDTSEGAAPGQTIHVVIGSFDVRNEYDGETLKNNATKVTALVIEPSKGSQFANSLAAFGYSRLELGISVGGKYDSDGKKLSLDDFTIDGVKMGSLALKANFEDIDPAIFGADQGARMQALFGGGVSSIELKFANTGIFEQGLAFVAKQQGATPDAVKAQWAAAAGQMLPALLGGDPSSLKVAGEAQKFIAAPKNITLSVKPKDGGALKAPDFMAMSDPTAIAGKLDISAVANQ